MPFEDDDKWALKEIAGALTRIADVLTAQGSAALSAQVPNAVRQPTERPDYEPRRFGDGKKPAWWGMIYHRAKEHGLNSDALAQEKFGVASSKQLTVEQIRTLLDLPELQDEQI